MLAGVVDHVIGFAEVGKLFSRWADEHVVHEQRVVSSRTNDSDLQLRSGIPASKCVKYVKVVAVVQEVHSALFGLSKGGLFQRHVDVTPPDVVFDAVLHHDTFVFGAATGFVSRKGRQAAGLSNLCFVVEDGFLVQFCGVGVAQHAFNEFALGQCGDARFLVHDFFCSSASITSGRGNSRIETSPSALSSFSRCQPRVTKSSRVVT